MYCFEERAFEDAEFNPISFLEDCQSRNPIAQVHYDLVKFMQSLENQLVAIIDKDYAEFLQLSVKLKGINSSVLSLRSPLLEILDRVHHVKQSAKALLDKAENQVYELQAMRKKKEELKLSISIGEKLEAVESLLAISYDDTPHDDADVEDEIHMKSILTPTNTSIQLERASRLTIELGYRFAQGVEISYILSEEPRMIVVERTLRQKLEAEFATEIVPDSFYAREHTMNISNVDHLLRAYVILQESTIPENMIAKQLIQPHLEETMTRGRLDGKHRGSCEGLASIYSNILEFIERKLGDILRLPICQGDEKNSVDILGRSIWQPIHDTMRSKLAEVFTPANPDRFYHNFTTSMAFMESLRQFCLTDEAKTRFQGNISAFQTSWNLPVYMQLRQNELNQLITASTGKRPHETFLLQDVNGYAFPYSTQLSQVLLKCWSDGIFVSSLVVQFARLTLQYLSQYSSYWHESLTLALEMTKTSPKVSFQDLNHPSLTSCDDIYCLGNDLNRLGNLLKEEVALVMGRRISEAKRQDEFTTDSNEFAHQLLEEQFQSLKGMEMKCWDIAISLIAEECKRVLPAVRTIKGQYQMTNKPMPKTCSLYVPTITRPLEDFCTKWGCCLGSFSIDFNRQVFSSTFEVFTSLSIDLIKSATELEESLKSRKNQRLASSILDEGVSDTDKMRRQLYLDMEELARIAKSFQVDVTEFPSYQHLHEDVMPK